MLGDGKRKFLRSVREVLWDCQEYLELVMMRCVEDKARIERKLASKVDLRVLRWFGHVERIDEYFMFGWVLMAEVSEGQVWSRPRLGWMDGVKLALGSRGMTA